MNDIYKTRLCYEINIKNLVINLGMTLINKGDKGWLIEKSGGIYLSRDGYKWRCLLTGEKGDIIDFTMKLFACQKYEAINKILAIVPPIPSADIFVPRRKSSRDISNCDAKELFSRARHIQARIRHLEMLITTLRELGGKCTATLSDMPKGGNTRGSVMADTIDKLVDLEAEREDELINLVRNFEMMKEVLNGIKDLRHKDILEMYYMQNLTWENIAEILHLAPRHAQRLLMPALAAADEVLKKRR